MTRTGSKRLQRNLKIRKRLWPKLRADQVWNWKNRDGFTTIPRAMPYFFKIMDDLSKSKPISSTYFALWCRLWDESGLIKATNTQLLAQESGFSGQRAISTWRNRMKILEKWGFIKAKPLAAEQYGYILLLNPYKIVKKLYEEGKYTDEGWYNALYDYADFIKATDMDEDDEDDVEDNEK